MQPAIRLATVGEIVNQLHMSKTIAEGAIDQTINGKIRVMISWQTTKAMPDHFLAVRCVYDQGDRQRVLCRRHRRRQSFAAEAGHWQDGRRQDERLTEEITQLSDSRISIEIGPFDIRVRNP